ncbi:UPF0287-domain-containing protein [Cylindrobasidium torrendii FP15055 ss-10]|uniref:COX assembly mitochondrial protein n=1 Tax=Cylindrobasidium torrendii FP15055 ss-10 TaxID=1314674 RepID=A0A0D7BHK4_9AGAR|nr:UPF0287-domain-containing protein [Cylindrobasidium torrendii FP15055 ss-10]
MHPQLSTPDKRLVCKDFIKALEDCHTSHWSAKFLGKCNQQKNTLNECLHGESVKRRKLNNTSAKESQAKQEAHKKSFYADI